MTGTLVYLPAYLNIAGMDPDTGQTIDHNRADDNCKAMQYAGYLLDAVSVAERSTLRAAVERAIAWEHVMDGPLHDWPATCEEMLPGLDERAASTDAHPF